MRGDYGEASLEHGQTRKCVGDVGVSMGGCLGESSLTHDYKGVCQPCCCSTASQSRPVSPIQTVIHDGQTPMTDVQQCIEQVVLGIATGNWRSIRTCDKPEYIIFIMT